MAGIELIACLPYSGILRLVVTRQRPWRKRCRSGHAEATDPRAGSAPVRVAVDTARSSTTVPSMPSILVAPDSFKGTFSAVEVADAIGRGIERAGLEVDRCPV